MTDPKSLPVSTAAAAATQLLTDPAVAGFASITILASDTGWPVRDADMGLEVTKPGNPAFRMLISGCHVSADDVLRRGLPPGRYRLTLLLTKEAEAPAPVVAPTAPERPSYPSLLPDGGDDLPPRTRSIYDTDS